MKWKSLQRSYDKRTKKRENDLASFVKLIHRHAEGLHAQIRYVEGFTAVHTVMPHPYLSRLDINSEAVQEINCIVNVDQHKRPLSQGGHQ